VLVKRIKHEVRSEKNAWDGSGCEALKILGFMREFARHIIGSNDYWLLQGPSCKTSTTHLLPLDWRQTAALVAKSPPAPVS
jgi:hypothetical protein